MNIRFFYRLLTVGGIFALQTGRTQETPSGFTRVGFPSQSGVQLMAFVEQKPTGVGQRVWWGAKNLTTNNIEISFIKSTKTTCGKTLRENAQAILGPGESIVNGELSGELSFETLVGEEECDDPQNRIASVQFEKLIVKNLTGGSSYDKPSPNQATSSARSKATTSAGNDNDRPD